MLEHPRGVAQFGSALAWGARGPGFKSRRPDGISTVRPLIVIPTYNERVNLRRLVPRIRKAAPRAALLIVDDASPDGTAAFARRLGRGVHVLPRPAKLGLGTAYLDGFRWGLRHGYDPVLQMDADGSHDPATLPVMLAALARADAVVGSRYLGGIRVMNWPWMRLFLSYFANAYARLVTGVPLTDLTGGYNGWRAGLLKRLGLDRMRCNGYAFQIELKERARRAGARFVEVPIVFTGRVEGESKLSRSVVWEAIFAVWRLRLGWG